MTAFVSGAVSDDEGDAGIDLPDVSELIVTMNCSFKASYNKLQSSQGTDYESTYTHVKTLFIVRFQLYQEKLDKRLSDKAYY